MRRKIGLTVALLVALVLEILPYGAVCVFANPEGKDWRRTYSYFDLTPFGYANFAPFVVALLTCVLLLLVGILWGTKRDVMGAVRVLSTGATVLSLAPLLFGIRFFSPIGACITVALAVATVVAWRKNA